MIDVSSVTTPGQLIHAAWRSVRVEDPANNNDLRLRSSYYELADHHQALCIVTEGRIEQAIGRQLISGKEFDASFVRGAMEQIYEGYNRFTLCINGLGRLGLDWFADSSEAGVRSIRAVPPYSSLSHTSKEIDRRMVVLILNTLDESQLPSWQLEAIGADAAAILNTAYSGAYYDYTLGYACEASFD